MKTKKGVFHISTPKQKTIICAICSKTIPRLKNDVVQGDFEILDGVIAFYHSECSDLFSPENGYTEADYIALWVRLFKKAKRKW